MSKGGIGGPAPYGYKSIAENGIKTLVPDTEAAEVVKTIFRLFIGGMSRTDIAKYLNEHNIPSPYMYRFRDKPERLIGKTHLKWTNETVNQIIKKDVYMGRYTANKRSRALYRNEGLHHTSEDEWLIFEDHHEAIISKEDFERAVEIDKLKSKPFPQSKAEDNILSGKVFCKCGYSMGFTGLKDSRRYECYKRKKYGKTACTCKSVSAEEIYKKVYNAIKEQMALLLDEDAVVKNIKSAVGTDSKISYLISEKKDIDSKIKSIFKQKSELYADFSDGILSETEYLEINNSYSSRIEEFEKMLLRIDETIDSLASSALDDEKIRELIHKYTHKRKLSKDMVEAFIEKVIIYDGKQIEVKFNFSDVIDKTLARNKERQAMLND